VYLLFVVLNNEDLLDDLIAGWLDIGITGATVIESTDSVQLISHHVPIFAGFRSLTSGGMQHNKTIFSVVEDKASLDAAIHLIENLCEAAGKPHQGIYFVAPLAEFGRLGRDVDPEQHRRHMEKKYGRPLK
jgi:nitrogen regulatory protein P-II 1